MQSSTAALIALACAATLGTVYGVDNADVTASANGWDTRTSGNGCSPSGCIAANAIDPYIDPNSRWSCDATVSGIDYCELTLSFNEPQDLEQMRIAMWKGDVRTRAMKVFVDDDYIKTIESSGTTEDYESYGLHVPQASTVVLRALGDEDDGGWISITGVLFFTEEELSDSTSTTTSTTSTPPTTSEPSTDDTTDTTSSTGDKNSCLVDSGEDDSDYKCVLSGGLGETLDLSSCGLTDSDLSDVIECFETVGKEEIGTLTLTDNQFTTIPAELLSGLTNLGSLLMRYNNLVSVHPDAFATQTIWMDQLWLSGHQLTTLPAGVFDTLTTLFSLGLEDGSDLQCVPSTNAYEIYVDSDEILNGTCECEPASVVMCDDTTPNCEPGDDGYTCVA